jgi:hypothetical protein
MLTVTAQLWRANRSMETNDSKADKKRIAQACLVHPAWKKLEIRKVKLEKGERNITTLFEIEI